MSDHFAEVALPLATGTGLGVPETVGMKRAWAVIAADQLAVSTTDPTLVCVAICESFLGLVLDGRLLSCYPALNLCLRHGEVSKSSAHQEVNALHVDFFEDKLRVFPIVDVKHVVVR